jgi:hypothetical protein
MNWVNWALAIGIIVAAVLMAIFSDGLSLPVSLPMTVYALKRVGVVV